MRTFLLTISVDRKIKQVLAVLCFICLVSCKQETKPYSQITGAAQGTTFKIVFESVSEQDYSSSIDSLLKVIDESMSLWDQNSLISRINTFEDTLIIDSHFKKVFERTTVLERTLLLNQLIFDASKAYWDWYSAWNTYEIFDESVQLAEFRFRGVRESFLQGDVPAIDTLEALCAGDVDNT